MNWMEFALGFIPTTILTASLISLYRSSKRVNADYLSTLKTLEIYRERNAQLEKFESELKDAQLKMKVMQMLINDDEAIDELLDAKIIKQIHEDQQAPLIHYRQNQLAATQQMGAGGCLNGSVLGGLFR